MSHALDPCRFKLVRAAEHLQSLKSEVVAFFEREPYGETAEFDAKTSEYVCRVRVFEQPPDRWGVIIGDFIHNLCSALDQLAWQLVLANRGTPMEGRTGFPIFEDPDKWRGGRGGPWMMEGIASDHQALIERCQPYHAPKPERHALAILRRLWNTDKHRHLNMVMSVGGDTSALDFEAVRDIAPGALTNRVSYTGPLVDGAIFARVPITVIGAHPRMNVYGHMGIEVAFREGGPVGEKVLPILETLLREVRSTVKDFGRDVP